MQLTDYQRDILIRTALGEARGEGVEGMADVLQTVFNRANSGLFPSDPAEVALQEGEYSAWNKGAGGNNPWQFSQDSDIYRKGAQALDLVLNGRPDYTGGALFYKTPGVNSAFHDRQDKFGTIERYGHVYYPTRPLEPPVPATMSQDLVLMRNPAVSQSARDAQVTPMRDVPLPRPRPLPVDAIISQTMESLKPPPPRANAMRAADIGLTRPNGVTPRLTPQGDNAYTYWIPDMTHVALVGGRGSLTPSIGATASTAPFPATQSPHLAAIRARDQDLQTILNARYPTRLPELPPSNIGRPPTTRFVQSVPMNMAPTAREIAGAPSVTGTSIPTGQPVRPGGSAFANIEQQRQEQMALRTPQRMSDIGDPIQFGDIDMMFNWRPQPAGSVNYRKGNERLPRGVPGLPQAPMPNAAGPMPQINVVPAPRLGLAPPVPPANGLGMPSNPPRAAMATPMAPPPLPTTTGARQQQPLRLVVNGGNYSAPRPRPLTLTQVLQTAGLSSADAYELVNAKAAQRARDSASSPIHVSSNSWFNEVTGRS